MRRFLIAALLLFLAFARGPILAQGVLPGDRWPVHGTPVICGREIPQFVIFERVRDHPTDKNRSNHLRVSPGNIFIPVSQDKNGFFYHALIGIIQYDYEYGDLVVPGGIYVSKTVPNQIFIYFGDARKPGWVLQPQLKPLPLEVLEKLRIGHAAEGAQKKAPKKNR